MEILSPSTRGIDQIRKMALFARSGVGEYWIVAPERRTLGVHALDGEDYRAVEPNAQRWVASRVFPGLMVDPAEVFAGLD